MKHLLEMPRNIPVLLLMAAVWGCSSADNGSLVKDPAVPSSDKAAQAAGKQDAPKGETFYVVFDTSKGPVLVAAHPGWAPEGAKRFREVVEQKYYDDCRFFRVIKGFMAQVGISGDPAQNAKWRRDTIQDDPVKVSNTRGKVTFAKGPPNSRTTQIFFNYADQNARLDPMGFPPFGEVIAGMDVLDSLYSEYGDSPEGGGRGPNQEELQQRGNEYLNAQFPKLDYIKTARLYDSKEAAEAAMKASAPEAAAAPGGEAPQADKPANPNPEQCSRRVPDS